MRKLPKLKFPRLKLPTVKLPAMKLPALNLPSLKVIERKFRAGLTKVVTPLEKISIFKSLDVPGSRKSIRLHLSVGLAVVTLLTCGIGGWAATAQISGALIAPGSIVVDSNVKKVQHPTGGVVGEVRARDGDRVKAGDVVVRLDDTVTKASLAIVTKQLNGLWARAARLMAEQEGADHITFPPQIMDAMSDPDVKSLVANEI